jgi:glycosyltransferase involved in cell wall biosynthesis
VEVHQFATSLAYGDAISDEMLEIQKILREKGHQSEIFIRFYDPRMAGSIRDYREYREFSSPENVVIFHFSIASPVSKMFFRVPDKKIMIYHNITPYEHYLDSHRILTRECYKGRLEIQLFVDKVDLALGDSEFNRQELEEVGYPRTGVLPLLLDFTKFDREGDPVTEQVFSNGKTTLLFVGRIIPNKKYEDIIKVFYFYKKYFNSNSQLLMVGDYRGFERYLAGLFDFVKKLELSDVYFTGHVEFKELISFYRLSHFYLSLSEHEGFGVPLLEAFYTRVPVVAYVAGAVEETLNSGGVILRSKNFFKTAALIDTINKDRSLRDRIISSQVKALDKYKRENIGKILLRHIERVKKR